MKTQYEEALEQHGYVALKDIGVGHFVSVFGLVVHASPIKPPRQSGKSYSCSLRLTDPTLNQSTITMNFFRQDSSMLPMANVGDIIFTKDVKVKSFNNSPQLMNEKEMFFVCIDPHTRKAKIPTNIIMHFTRSDADIVALLYHWSLSNTVHVQAARVSSIGRPTLTTREIHDHPSRYFDYIGMVVGCLPEQDAVRKTNLLLTDFTDNPKPYMDDTSEHQINVAHTKLLQCTLWDENSETCPKLELGTYVFLRNCSRNEKNRNVLEISVRGDRNSNGPSKNRVRILEPNDPLLKHLLERKSRHVSINGSISKKKSNTIGWGSDPLRTRVKDLKGHKSLKDIKEAQQPGLYLTRAIVTKILPDNVKDWIVGQCKHYQVPLVVSDKEAELLFLGLSAEDTCVDESSMKRLRKLARLIRNDDKNIYYDIGICCYDTPGFGQSFRITHTEFIENKQQTP
ncbi:hypothetical protein BD560DRAFT_442267 [Blakeslea trispora]|nr:hypothetical protein BD560DRAFT_442267 [Blakeslea trispora]